MKVSLYFIAIAGVFFSCNQTPNSSPKTETYKEKVLSLEELERNNPKDFLSIDGSYRENFWGNKLNVECKIINSAKVVKYKDAVVRVTYYTKTKTALSQKEIVIYEIFSPNSTKTVALKLDNYQDVNSIDLDIVSAKVYN
jgi:hypothetical protein